MRQAGFFRSETTGTTQTRRSKATSWLPRLLPPVLFFAIAFAVDMLTGQRYSSVWGSAAIIASLVALFPAIVPALAALGTYAAIWVGFNVIRAFADDAGIALGGVDLIADIERAMFGGTLPSTALQDIFFDLEATGVHDVALSLVHGSFFIVPFVVAIVLWLRSREALRLYAVSTAITFALGLLGFLLLPTAPPWMAAPDEITRVTHHLLATTTDLSLHDGAGGFTFEPNHLAAMPSVHVAATVLVFLAVRRFGPVANWIGAVYAVAMSVAVVYLGEHYILDAVAGWGIAVAGWILASRVRARGGAS